MSRDAHISKIWMKDVEWQMETMRYNGKTSDLDTIEADLADVVFDSRG